MSFLRPDRNTIAGHTNPADARQPLPIIASRATCLFWKEMLNLTSSVFIGLVSEMSRRSDTRKLLAVGYDSHPHRTYPTPDLLLAPAKRSRYGRRWHGVVVATSMEFQRPVDPTSTHHGMQDHLAPVLHVHQRCRTYLALRPITVGAPYRAGKGSPIHLS